MQGLPLVGTEIVSFRDKHTAALFAGGHQPRRAASATPEGIIQVRFSSDDSCINASHAIADAMELCGVEKIVIKILGGDNQNVALISDEIDDDRSFLERQHVIGAGYTGSSTGLSDAETGRKKKA